MLVVMAIMGILGILVSIAFQSILGTAFDSEVSDLSNILVRARAYAMANNTYVFVGIEEVNASVASSTTPQTTGNGRIGVVVVATNDGSKGYDSTSVSSSTALPETSLNQYANTKLVVVAPLRHFENIHMIVITPGTLSGSPGNTTSTGATFSVYNLAIPANGTAASGTTTGGATYTTVAATSLIYFCWPLSAAAAAAQYTFGYQTSSSGSVIQFNPQGEASIYGPPGPNGDTYLQWIEIDLQPTHGNNVPATVTNKAAIQIDGPSGAVTSYRP